MIGSDLEIEADRETESDDTAEIVAVEVDVVGWDDVAVVVTVGTDSEFDNV